MLFGTNELPELYGQMLVVQRTAMVEYMRLHGALRVAHCRIGTYIDNGGVLGNRSGIDTGKREEFLAGIVDIGRRETYGTTDTVAMDDLARQGVCIAKHTIGILNMPRLYGASNARRTDRFTGIDTLTGMLHTQPDMRCNMLVISKIRQSVRTKMMVVPHQEHLHTFDTVQALHKLLSSKVLHLAEIQHPHFGILAE